VLLAMTSFFSDAPWPSLFDRGAEPRSEATWSLVLFIDDTGSPLLATLSSCLVSLFAIRILSLSLKALTLIGATVGTIADDAVDLDIGVIVGRVDVDIFGVVAVEEADVLGDLIVWG